VHYTTSCNTQASAPKDGRDQCPKHVELIGIINKPLLLHLVGVYIIYMQLTVYKLRRIQFQSSSELCGSSVSLMKQQLIVTQWYIDLYKAEKTRQTYTQLN